MQSTLFESLSGLIGFCKYFVAALGFMIVFCKIYFWITPYDEMRLIREGRIAPAISFGGALIGFILPLYSAITHSVGFIDMLIWAVVAMVMQFTVFGIVKIFFKTIVHEIENDHSAAATLLAFFSVAIGLLNAACMTY
jgi:putative membrane protein